MSRLEVQAEDFIFRSDRVLDAEQAHDLSRWLAKTSVIINVSQGYRLLWPRESRHQLRDSIPACVRVCIFRTADRDLNWGQGGAASGVLPLHWPLDVQAKVLDLVHPCLIRVDDIVSLVVHVPREVSYARLHTSGLVLWDGRRSEGVDLGSAPLLEDWLAADFHLDITRPSAFQPVPQIECYEP